MLAHQGGWDEIGLVALPIVVFAALLWLANRRADAAVRAGGLSPDAEPDLEPERGVLGPERLDPPVETDP